MAQTPDPEEREIFEAALLLPLEDRDGYLHQACDGRPELELRLRRLLRAHDRARESPTEVLQPAVPAADPQRIGPYRLLEQIGEGGMGIVYIAAQEQPVRRRVALKVIKAGMDTKEVIARFHSERQALALMNHRNIARILDAGATDEGRPYFVMEYVPGMPLLEYCDQRRLGIDERLGLFIDVCMAVQHAHQKGVVHRDIKPSNLLVMEEDGRPTPKVIDFGVAKAVSSRLSDLTVHTRLGGFVGTPDYISPEQAKMTGLDVDTRADVYSLGAVLYELLTGARPFDFSDTGFGLLEIQTAISQQDPLLPSLRARRDGEDSKLRAADRRSDSPALARTLRQDLDWVVMKALEKDRNRRYSSASELAAEIQRYLARQPVVARPPSTAYRLSRFLRRHAAAVAAGASIAALVLGLIGFYTFQLARERDRANREARRASQEAAAAERVSEFLVDLFQVSDPSEAKGETITARELLDEGAESIAQELADQPEIQARLLATMGQVYQNLGLYGSAEALLERALALRTEILGEEHPDVAESLDQLAWLFQDTGDYDASEAYFRRALAMQLRLLGEEHATIADIKSSLGGLLDRRGEAEEAEHLLRQALAIWRRLPGEDEGVATSLNNLALFLKRQGDYEAAEVLYREALTLRRRLLGDEHPYVAISLNNLGALLVRKGQRDLAEPLFREALALRRKVFGEEHPDVATSLNNLATVLREKGELEASEELFRRSLEMTRKLLGPDHPELAVPLANLARVMAAQGDHTAAEPLFAEALAIFAGVYPPDHWQPAQVRVYYGASLKARGRYREAEGQMLAGHAALEKSLGGEHERTRAAAAGLAELYGAWGRPAEAARFRATEGAGSGAPAAAEPSSGSR